ncbi:MAG: right-handed parallel beta-helix repeat-containing protein [Parvibaculum sp.]|nr:right-handed parallel beta-helix repeat-containing protein [Parvibaculum sp.]
MNRRDLFANGGAAALLLTSPSAFAAPLAPAAAGLVGLRSALEFGVTGDGLVDETDALQGAMDAVLNASAPSFLVIPPGRYRVSRPLRIEYRRETTGNVTQPHGILAHGATLLSGITDGSDVLTITSHATTRFLLMEGLAIRGNRSEGRGLVFDCNREGSYIYNLCLRDIFVENCGSDGLNMIGNIFEGQIFNCYFRDNGGTGAVLKHGDAGGVLSAIHVFGSVFGGNANHGAVLSSPANDASFHGCYFLENGLFGLSAANGCPLLSHCGFENNHMKAGSKATGDAGARISNFGTLVGCTSHSIHYQTHLVRSYIVGDVTMIGCSASGSRLAALQSSGTGRATVIGCRGEIDHTGAFRSVRIGQQAGAVFGSDWNGMNLVHLGDYRLWVDAGGNLRMKRGAPVADDDGKLVGT